MGGGGGSCECYRSEFKLMSPCPPTISMTPVEDVIYQLNGGRTQSDKYRCPVNYPECEDTEIKVKALTFVGQNVLTDPYQFDS
jgi:hypothetical protein